MLKGAYYNIIRVPPTKQTPDETLEGTTVLCTIPSVDKTKPSYYHSFGEQKFSCSNQSWALTIDHIKGIRVSLCGDSNHVYKEALVWYESSVPVQIMTSWIGLGIRHTRLIKSKFSVLVDSRIPTAILIKASVMVIQGCTKTYFYYTIICQLFIQLTVWPMKCQKSKKLVS